ncbi:MAG: hypothetical protein GY713_04095 [Actinomycetia bacterium]|nr:hypothetical protein [Actinomycetes bacterium]
MTMNEVPVDDNDVVSPRTIVQVWGDRGASLVEHSMLVALIAVVCITALQVFGDGTDGLVGGSADSIVAATDAAP